MVPQVKISVSDPDPDTIRSVDPDPDSESGSRRTKMTHKSRKSKEISCFERLDVLFESFFCILDVLSGGLGLSKLQVLIKIRKEKNFGHQTPESVSGSEIT
jgi:hypothetical protein